MIPFLSKAKKAKERFCFGLDIGTQFMKIVKLKFNDSAVELSDFKLEPVQLDLGAIIKGFRDAQGADIVNVSACGPATVIRYINFPKMNAGELRQALKFEAQKHIPFSMEDVLVDGFILKDDLPDNKMFVLLAAAKKEFINQRIKLVEDSGMRVNLIDIDSLALVNAFNFNYSGEEALKDKAVALLNIGASVTSVNILEGGRPCFSRDIHIAGNNFTQKLADVLALDFKSAEALKIKPGSDSLNKLISSIEPVLANLANEIRVSFDFYESQNTSSVAKIFLSGGSSAFAGLKNSLAGLIGLEMECWDPLKKVAIQSAIQPDKLKEVSGQLAVCVGLALRE